MTGESTGTARVVNRAIAAFVALFAIKPVLDLEWLSPENLRVLGQRINPATIVGVLLLALPVLVMLSRPAGTLTRRAAAAFAVIVLYLAFKFLTGFADKGLIIRFASCESVLLFLIYFLEHDVISRPTGWILVISVGVIVALGLLQIAGVVPTLLNDRINSAAVGRVTGGYGHPLSLSRVVSFSAILVLLAYHRSIEDFKRPVVIGWLALYGVMAVCVFRSTYRTGILFISGAPFLLFFLPGATVKRRVGEFLAAIVGLSFAFSLASSSVVSVSGLFGHSSGIVLNEKATVAVATVAVAAPDVVERTDWDDQAKRVGRGRGEIWMTYGSQMRVASPWQWLIGHRTNDIQVEDRLFSEPHNMLILSLYAFGVLGTILFLGFYVLIWHSVDRLLIARAEARACAALAFCVPLWFSMVAEPLRYPTFFTMLFLAVAFIDRWTRVPTVSAPAH